MLTVNREPAPDRGDDHQDDVDHRDDDDDDVDDDDDDAENECNGSRGVFDNTQDDVSSGLLHELNLNDKSSCFSNP